MSNIIAILNAIRIPADRMRRLRPEVVAELAESMATRGLIEPIVLRPGRNGHELVAGWHRLKAAEELGWGSIAAIVMDGADAADTALLVEIDENLVRADLSPAERGRHLAERKRLYEKLHPETKRGVAGGKARHDSATAKMSFAESTAKATAKSQRTIQREVKRASCIVDLAAVAGTALDTADELDALAKLPETAQRELIERAASGESVTAKHVAHKLRRESRERELAEATEAASQTLGEKRYAVILADPPWRFELWAESGKDSVADNHYPTMPIELLTAMPVPAADNCVLFLWATVPMLPHALEVMSAWGFVYKSLLIWEKDRDGTGYWTRNRVEILLIGTKGAIPAPMPGEQPPQLIQAPRGRHSEKPEIVAQIIERLYPTAAKIELFARKARSGWDVHGNEVSTAESAAIPDDDLLLSIPSFLRRTEGVS